VTTQFTSYAQNVHHRLKRTLAFSDIFPKHLRNFSPNFTYLLLIPIYVRLQIFIELSPTTTKLCHINRHPRKILSNVTSFVRPESPFSSKFLIFVQILLSYCRLFNLHTDKFLLISKSEVKTCIKS